MKRCSAVVTGVLCLAVTGCNTLQVKRAAAPAMPPAAGQSGRVEPVPGVPFYVKRAVCLQTVVWLEPVYTFALEKVTTPPEGKDKATSEPIGSTTLSLSQLQSGATQAFMRGLNSGSASEGAIDNAWKAVAGQVGAPYEPTGFPPAADRILISNSSDPQVYVDYSQPYYLNARRPVAGSTKLDTKLASDGTLTEASVEVTDTTIESFGTAVKSLSGAITPFAATRGVGTSSTTRAKLTITLGGFKHTLSKFDLSSGLPCAAAGPDISPPYRYTRVDVSAAAVKTDAKTDAKGSKISVSGEIVIPDAKAAATGAAAGGDKKPYSPE